MSSNGYWLSPRPPDGPRVGGLNEGAAVRTAAPFSTEIRPAPLLTSRLRLVRGDRLHGLACHLPPVGVEHAAALFCPCRHANLISGSEPGHASPCFPRMDRIMEKMVSGVFNVIKRPILSVLMVCIMVSIVISVALHPPRRLAHIRSSPRSLQRRRQEG